MHVQINWIDVSFSYFESFVGYKLHVQINWIDFVNVFSFIHIFSTMIILKNINLFHRFWNIKVLINKSNPTFLTVLFCKLKTIWVPSPNSFITKFYTLFNNVRFQYYHKVRYLYNKIANFHLLHSLIYLDVYVLLGIEESNLRPNIHKIFGLIIKNIS